MLNKRKLLVSGNNLKINLYLFILEFCLKTKSICLSFVFGQKEVLIQLLLKSITVLPDLKLCLQSYKAIVNI